MNFQRLANRLQAVRQPAPVPQLDTSTPVQIPAKLAKRLNEALKPDVKKRSARYIPPAKQVPERFAPAPVAIQRLSQKLEALMMDVLHDHAHSLPVLQDIRVVGMKLSNKGDVFTLRWKPIENYAHKGKAEPVSEQAKSDIVDLANGTTVSSKRELVEEAVKRGRVTVKSRLPSSGPLGPNLGSAGESEELLKALDLRAERELQRPLHALMVQMQKKNIQDRRHRIKIPRVSMKMEAGDGRDVHQLLDQIEKDLAVKPTVQ
ncbi:MAG: hypothetical protein SGCHY_005029 [Lobulomycetales sp.]